LRRPRLPAGGAGLRQQERPPGHLFSRPGRPPHGDPDANHEGAGMSAPTADSPSRQLRKETDMTANEAAMRRRARIMRAVNVPMRAVLSLPFATPLSSNLMLVSYTGRKTGKAYRQPVSYVHDGKVLLTPGGGRWTLNLAGGRPITIRL